MCSIELIDWKGDFWQLIWVGAPKTYLHNGEIYWKAWWYAPARPKELINYYEVPLPIFTDWFTTTKEQLKVTGMIK